MRASSKDHTVVAPPQPPAIRHTSEESHATVTADLRDKYERAALYAGQQNVIAEKEGQEVARLTVELGEAERRQREAQQNAQRGQDVANDYAAHLAAAGTPVTYHVGQPPYGDGLHASGEAAMQRFNQAVDEQRASEAAGRQP